FSRGNRRFPRDSIGVPRFELGTSPTRTERATRLRHTPSARRLAPHPRRLWLGDQFLEGRLRAERVEIRVVSRQLPEALRALDRLAQVLDRVRRPIRESLGAGDVVGDARVLRMP